jgi:hypothetical protein
MQSIIWEREIYLPSIHENLGESNTPATSRKEKLRFSSKVFVNAGLSNPI